MAWFSPVASGPNALGDLSGQYWNVAQSNLRTQEGDIARANAAQQNFNRWQANVADLTNQQEAEQYRRDQIGRGEQRQQFEWGVRRQDAAARDALAATLEREGRDFQTDFRTGRNEKQNFATLQSLITSRKVRNIDEAWAYLDKTPDNVLKVTKLLDTADKAFTQETLEAYDSQTARVQADQLASVIKAKGAGITDKDKEDAMWLDSQTLAIIPRTVGTVIPGAKWDYKNKKWSLDPENTFQPAVGELRRSDDNLNLSRWTPAPPRAVTTPQVGNQGGGYFPPTPAPRVDLSQFRTGTNAPMVAPSAVRRFPPAFYDRVNQLVASGVDPRVAKARAMQEFSR